MGVRSRRLFGPVGLNPTVDTLFTCPAGRTAIIHTLAVVNRDVAVDTVVAILLNGDQSVNRIWRNNLLVNTSVLLETHIVLNPGDTLRALRGAGTATLSGFGSLLLGEPE